MRIFEKQEDLDRENKAIKAFVNVFDGDFKKLDQLDVDYKIIDSSGNLIAYAEVKGRIRVIRDAFPLPISLYKLGKLMDKRIAGVVIWACDDGIIYGKPKDIYGTVRWGGRPQREGSYSDAELMVYYDKQKGLKYIRY